MTLAVPGPGPLAFTSRTPSIVILGADATLAALPATPVQLAHACMKAGFQHVVPASWGDELIANGVMRQLDAYDDQPIVQCTCPLVTHRLLSVGTDLGPFLVTLAPPPVALARYLRALYGTARLRITYVGRCPGAADDVIDARLTPDELLALFADRHIVLADQPQVFDSVIPPDRRRHFSQPGGVPTPDALWTNAGGRALVEITSGDLTVELAQLLLTERKVLIDPSPVLGCACSGASVGTDVARARERVIALEPPHSPSPIVDPRVAISLVPSQPGTTRAHVEPAPRDMMLPMHADVEVAATLPLVTMTAYASASSLASMVLEAPSSVAHDVTSLPAAELEVTSADPVVAVRITPAPQEAATSVAPVAVTPEPTVEATESPAPYEHARNEVVVTAVASEAPGPDPAQLEIALSAPEQPTTAARRTAPFGIMRAVLGETPMTRDSSGRQLPRAYVLRRRSSARSGPMVLSDVTREVDDAIAPSSLPETSEVADQANDGAAVEESRTAAPPAIEAAPAPVAPPPLAQAMAIVASVGTESVVTPKPLREKERDSTPSPEPLRDAERTVDLPVERLSDGPPAARRRATQPRTHAAPTTAPVEAKSPQRAWMWIALLVLAVALIGSAAGAVFATWYARTHPPASTQR